MKSIILAAGLALAGAENLNQLALEKFITDDEGYVVVGEQSGIQKKSHMKKESDEVCDGDSRDNKEIENENNTDDFVEDHGFSRDAHNWVQTKTEGKQKRESDDLCDGDGKDNKEIENENNTDDFVEDHGFSRDAHNWIQTKLDEKKQIKKESDDLCDGDAADDKVNESETDPADHVVDDYGFARNWL